MTAALLLIAMLFTIALPSHAAVVTPPTVSPLYTAANDICADITITSTGYASITVTVMGTSSTNTISLVTYLEKYNYGMWTRVAIGTTNNEWKYTKNGTTLNKTYSYPLTVSGQYRVVSLVTLNGDSSNTVTVTDYTSF